MRRRRLGARQYGGIAHLILLNGPPGVGKSTLARRFVDDNPLALLVEIDDLRTSMGGWDVHDESKLQARTLALALVRAHLAAGYDVVVPQYLGRPDFADQLHAAASAAGAQFAHLVLADERHAVAKRFRSRRRQILAGGAAHPQTDVSDPEIEAVIADAERQLAELASERTDTTVVRLPAGDPYDGMLTALGQPTRDPEAPGGSPKG